MAIRVHQRADGTWGECSADERKCPLGGEHLNFDSVAELDRFNEQVLESKYGSFEVVSKTNNSLSKPFARFTSRKQAPATVVSFVNYRKARVNSYSPVRSLKGKLEKVSTAIDSVNSYSSYKVAKNVT